MTDTQIIEFLQDNSEFFTSNSMVAGFYGQSDGC